MEIAAALGRVGLPAPLAELARREWDAIVVGGGHNGLTAAAYLARAGKRVLVLERREQLGGACTLEQPFDDERFLVSPCAYVVGLLDPLVVGELDLERHGYRVFPADPNLWCPLGDGRSLAQFIDFGQTAERMRRDGFTESDIRGLAAYEELFARARALLRAGPGGDTWVGSSPPRERIEEILGDPELISLVFDEPIAETIERYVSNEAIARALWGQGVIGTYAGPRDPGTASVKLMHHQGDLQGLGSVWGYVEGGMGRASFALAEAAREAGAVLASGVPVARIMPGEGVETESGDIFRAATVVSNADPKRTLALVDDERIPRPFAERVGAWMTRSPVIKLNAALSRLPAFDADSDGLAHRAMVSVAGSVDEGQRAFETCREGGIDIGFAEIYFQSAYDPSVAPPGAQTMSVFAQYCPMDLDAEAWEARRSDAATAIFDRIAERAPDVRDCVTDYEVLGPPDVEQRIGLTGGQIFQGDALPEQMWDRRLDYRSPIPGLYLCGAATHPGGSVIALNGRNAAFAVLGDLDA